MVELDNNTIYITRGDELILNFTIDDYIFKIGDKIKFGIYNIYEFTNKPLLEKNIIINENCNNIDIILTKNDTNIGIEQNKTMPYWYQIVLNDKYTVIGYNKNGPANFNLLPKGD